MVNTYIDASLAIFYLELKSGHINFLSEFLKYLWSKQLSHLLTVTFKFYDIYLSKTWAIKYSPLKPRTTTRSFVMWGRRDLGWQIKSEAIKKRQKEKTIRRFGSMKLADRRLNNKRIEQYIIYQTLTSYKACN